MSPTLQTINGVQVASLSGPFDNSTGSDLVTMIKTSVGRDARMILDFELVSSLDGQGLRHLLGLNQWFEQNGGRLVLAGMSPGVWAEVQQANCTEKFETTVSRSLALKVLGGEPASPALDEMEKSPAAPPAAPVDDFGAFEAGASDFPEVDSGIFSRPPPFSTAPTDDWSAPSPAPQPEPQASDWGGEGEGWNKFDKPPAREAKPNLRKSKPGKWLFVGVAAVVAVALTLGTFWMVDYLKVPVIEVGAHFIEAQEGQELADAEIWVRHGRLNADDIELPPGIEFADGEESPEGWKYYFGGIAKKPGTYTVTLTAARGNRMALPVEVVIEVKEKNMSWVFSQPPMTENVAIAKDQYTRIVVGAHSLTLNWAGDAAEGLIVENSEDTPGTWRLAGTPAKGGAFRAEFRAKSKSGREEKKNYLINVRPAPPPPPPPPPPLAQVDPNKTNGDDKKNDIDNDKEKSVEPAPEVQGVDDRMRTFLLERIEKANSHFTDDDKALLRTIVSKLQDARLVATVKFGNGQTKPDSKEAKQLIDELNKPETKKLMENPDCQVLVVGYASTTGPKSSNIKFSRLRAKAVNDLLRSEIGRNADLCGDYGPTDIISTNEAGNRVVEVYAGIIDIGKTGQAVADRFKGDFNKRHGSQ